MFDPLFQIFAVLTQPRQSYSFLADFSLNDFFYDGWDEVGDF